MRSRRGGRSPAAPTTTATARADRPARYAHSPTTAAAPRARASASNTRLSRGARRAPSSAAAAARRRSARRDRRSAGPRRRRRPRRRRPTSAHAACATAFDDSGGSRARSAAASRPPPPESAPARAGGPPIRLDSDARRWPRRVRRGREPAAVRSGGRRTGATRTRRDAPAGAGARPEREREAFARQVLTPRRVSHDAAAAMCARLAPVDGDAFGACVETAVGGASCLASLPALLSGG